MNFKSILLASLLCLPVSALASPASNFVGQTSICDPTNGSGKNCIKPTSSGHVPVDGGVTDNTSKTSQQYSGVAGVSETTPSTGTAGDLNYLSLDPNDRALRITQLPTTVGGLLIKSFIVAHAGGTPVSVAVCTAVCQVYGYAIYGVASATPVWVKSYNTVQGSTTCGSGTPIERHLIATAATGAGAIPFISSGAAYSTAMSVCIVTGIADNDTGDPAATSYVVNIYYKQ